MSTNYRKRKPMEKDLQSPDPEIIVGLDIGTTKIACFVGQRNEHGKIEILGHDLPFDPPKDYERRNSL